MELEFSEDLFKLGDESRGAVPEHVYSNERYGSVQAFVTEEEHARDFEAFENEFKDEIDKLIAFVKNPPQKTVDAPGGAPRLSRKNRAKIIRNLETFKLRLFTFDEEGRNTAYREESMDFVYANGESTFFTIVWLIEHEKTPVQTCLEVIENLAIKLTVCSGGVLDAMYDSVGKLKATLHGVKGLASDLTYETAGQEILDFMGHRHRDNPRYYPGMEVHFVNYYRNELGAPEHPSRNYGWLEKRFPWSHRPDPDYGTEQATGIGEADLKACYAVLKEKIRPSLIVQPIAERYFQEIKAYVTSTSEGDLRQRVETGAKYLEPRYGPVLLSSVLSYDSIHNETDWQPTSSLVALAILRVLAKEGLIAGEGPRILARTRPAFEGEPPQDLMQWERLFWVREWSIVPTEKTNPDQLSDLVPLRVAHLTLFSPQDVQASLARAGEQDSASVLQDIVQVAIAGVGMEEMLDIPAAWLRHMPLAAVIRTLQPLDPVRQADADQWSVFVQKALAAGVEIEEKNEQGQTPLLAAAEQGAPGAFMALIKAGANMLVEDNRGWNALLTWLAKGGGNIVGERRTALFEEAIAQCADIREYLNHRGQTPLLAAADWRLLDAFETLAGLGVNLQARNRHGENALTLLVGQFAQDDMSAKRWGQLLVKVAASGANVDEQNTQGETPILLAGGLGMVDAFAAFLDAGANPRARYQEDDTALMLLMHHVRNDIDAEQWSHLFQRAITNGANIEEENVAGETLVQQAARRGFVNAVTGLIEAGVNLRVTDEHGRTALGLLLAEASEGMNAKQWETLLKKAIAQEAEREEEQGQDRTPLIEEKDGDGQTLLMTAAKLGRIDLFTVLVDAGANLRVKDEHERTALVLLLSETPDDMDAQQWAALFAKAIAKDAETEEAQGKSQTPILEETSRSGETPLLVAGSRGLVSAFTALVNAGANPCVRGEDNETALMRLVEHASHDMETEQWAGLIEKATSKEADIEELNWMENTLLLEAATRGLPNAFMALTDAGANLLVRNFDGDDPLRLLMLHTPHDLNTDQWAALFKKAIDSDVDIEECPDGQTLLLAAAAGRLPNAFTALADAGADLLAVDDNHQNALLLWVNHWHDDMAAAFVARVCGDDALDPRMKELLDAPDVETGHWPRCRALDMNCPETLRAINAYLIRARENNWLTPKQFSRVVEASAEGRVDALKNGYTEVIEADNEFFITVMENGWLTQDEFYKTIVEPGIVARADEAPPSATAADDMLLIKAMEEGWLSENAYAAIAHYRATALKRGLTPHIETNNRLLIEAMDKGCLKEAAAMQILAAVDPESGIPYRGYALSGGYPEAIRADNKVLIHAMKKGLMSNEQFEQLVLSSSLCCDRYGVDERHLEAVQANDELIVEAMTNGWLSEKAFKEIVMGPLLNDVLSRFNALVASRQAEGLRVSNELLLRVGKNLDKSTFMEIVLPRDGAAAAAREWALILNNVDSIEADNEFLLQARQKELLTNEELKDILEAGRAFDINIRPGEEGAFLAHGKVILWAYGKGWLTEADTQDLEPEPDWLKNNLPDEHRKAQERRERSATPSDRESDDVYSTSASSEKKWTDQSDIELSSDLSDGNLRHGAMISPERRSASPEQRPEQPLITPPTQGEIAQEMRKHHLLPFTIAAGGQTREVTIYNDCALQVLFRLERGLLEAYRDRDNEKAWVETLTTLRNQLQGNAVHLNDISREAISSDLLKSLFGSRGIDIHMQEDPLALQPVPFGDRKSFDEQMKETLANGYKTGASFALLVGYKLPVSAKPDQKEGELNLEAEPDLVTIGRHNVHGGHFVTLIPAYHPVDSAGQPPIDDLDRQSWILSDSIGRRQLRVTTRQIVNGLADRQYELVCARDASVRFQNFERLAPELEGQVMSGPSEPGPSEQRPLPAPVRTMPEKAEESWKEEIDYGYSEDDRSVDASMDSASGDEEMHEFALDTPAAERPFVEPSESFRSVDAEEGRSESGDRLLERYVELFQKKIIADIVKLSPKLLIDIPIAEAEVKIMFEVSIPVGEILEDISNSGKLAARIINSLAVGDREGALAHLRVIDPNVPDIQDREIFPALVGYLAEQHPWREHVLKTWPDSFERRYKLAASETHEEGKRQEEDVAKVVTAHLTDALLKTRSILNQCGERNYELLLDAADRRLPRLPEVFSLQIESLPLGDVYCLKAELNNDDGRKTFLGLAADELKNNFSKKPESFHPGDRFEARIRADVCLLTETPSIPKRTINEERGKTKTVDPLFKDYLSQFQQKIITDIVKLSPDLQIDIPRTESEVKKAFESGIPAQAPKDFSDGGKLTVGIINSLAIGHRDNALWKLRVMHAYLPDVVHEQFFPTLAGYLAEQQPWREHVMKTWPDSFERRQKRLERERRAASKTQGDGQRQEDVQKIVAAHLTSALLNSIFILNQRGEQNYELLLDLADRRLPRLPETFSLQVESLPVKSIYCLKVELKDDPGRKTFVGLSADQLRNNFSKKPSSIRPGDRYEARIRGDICLLVTADMDKSKTRTRRF
jgi:ankyrin repeat protein